MDQQGGAVDVGLGVGQVVGQGLEGPQRLVELLAVLGVLGGDLEGVASAAHGQGGLQDHAVDHDLGPRVPAAPGRRRRRRPDRRPAPARRSKVTAYWVSEAMVSCCSRLTPAAAGSTRKSSTLARPGAGQHQRGGRRPTANGTCHFTPSSTQPARRPVGPCGRRSGPRLRARTRRPGSSQAGTTMAWPEAMAGSHAACWASVPAATRTPALSTALAKCGDGASERPELLVDDGRLQRGHLGAAVGRGQGQADEVEVGQLLPEVGGVADRVVLELADHLERGVVARTRRAPSGAASPARR